MKRMKKALGKRVFLGIYLFLDTFSPANYLPNYRAAMLSDYRALYEDAAEKKGVIGVANIWLRMLVDMSSFMVSGWSLQIQLIGSGKVIKMREVIRIFAQLSSGSLMLFAAGVAVLVWLRLASAGLFSNVAVQWIAFPVMVDGAIAVVGLVALIFWKGVADYILP